MKHLRRAFFAGVLTAAAFLVAAVPAQAKTIRVHSGESIQAAIDAAKPGDTIAVDPGVYSESLTITKNNLKLKGAGPGSTILDGTGAPDFSDGIDVLGAFDPDTFAPVNPPVKGTKIDGFAIRNFPSFGVFLFNAKDSTVSNSWAYGNAAYGISGFVLSGIDFLGNTAHDNGEPGFYIGDSPKAKAKVIGNTSYNNGVGGPEGFGFLFRDASHGDVRDNRAWDNCAGYVFADTDENPDPAAHWDVKDNWAAHNNGACSGEDPGPPPTSGIGFALLGAQDVHLKKNTAIDNHPTGPSIPSGGIVMLSTAAVGGSDPMKNVIEDNFAHGNGPPPSAWDIFWDESGSGNKFKHNDCDASHPSWICS